LSGAPPSGPSARRSVTATLIAFAVFAAAAVFAWTTFSERVQEGAPLDPHSGDVWVADGRGTFELP